MSKRKRIAADGSKANAKRHRKDGNETAAVAQANPALQKAPFSETVTMDERKREGQLYDLLGSEDEADRLLAADCIIFNLLGGDGVSETVLRRHLENRLLRGLASGRNASRLGFSLVITEILSQLFGDKDLAAKKYSGLTFESALGTLTDKTQTVGKVPGQEERDNQLGKLFGIECFVRSQILFNNATRWQIVLDMLLKLGYKKVWLRSQSGWVIVQALQQMGSKKMVVTTLERVAAAGLAKTPEGVAMWLVALRRFPDIKVKPWIHPLQAKSFGDLAAILKESFQHQGHDQGNDRGNATNKGKQANWTAQLHFVWDLILAHYAAEDADTQSFTQFWTRVVDGTFPFRSLARCSANQLCTDALFSKNATDGQKFKGFQVFQSMLAGLADQPSKLEALFSKNFMICLMNQAAIEDRYLHRAATKALKALEGTVASKPDTLVPILSNLLGGHGTYAFDQKTNTKTVDKLLQHLSSDNEKEILLIVQQPIASLGVGEASDTRIVLKAFIDYVSRILDSSVKVEGATSFSIALKELGKIAYSHHQDVPMELLTEQIRGLCRSRLETCFAKLLRSSNNFELFCGAVASIDAPSIAKDDAIKDAMEQALARMRNLLKRKSKEEAEKALNQGLALLHAVSIFQLYNEDADAMEVLQDLSQFSDRVKGGKLDGSKGAGSSELLVEILLSMVSRPSSLMRQVSQQVFEAFTSQISAEGLELLTDPLASGESAEGQQQLFHTEDDMDIDEEGDSSSGDGDDPDASDFELDSDVEFVGMAGEENEAEADSDDEEDDEDDEGDEETSNEKQEPIDLNELVGSILKSHGLDKDKDADSSEDDGNMSDSEMLALDEQLAKVLKPHVKASNDSKKQKKDAKQSVLNFKYRILDLLDIYVKNEALNPLALALLPPLLSLMRTTTTKPLASQACEIILNYQKILKKARSNKETVKGSPTPETLLPVLVEIHEEASKDQAHAYAKAASAASLVVGSLMFVIDKAAIRQVAAVYAKTQSEWVMGDVKLQPSFFTDWNNWCQSQANNQASQTQT